MGGGPEHSLVSLSVVWLPLVGAAVVGASGLPGLFLGRRSAAGAWTAAVLHMHGAAAALAGAGAARRTRAPPT